MLLYRVNVPRECYTPHLIAHNTNNWCELTRDGQLLSLASFRSLTSRVAALTKAFPSEIGGRHRKTKLLAEDQLEELVIRECGGDDRYVAIHTSQVPDIHRTCTLLNGGGDQRRLPRDIKLEFVVIGL